jgi:hypothetical protein
MIKREGDEEAATQTEGMARLESCIKENLSGERTHRTKSCLSFTTKMFTS